MSLKKTLINHRITENQADQYAHYTERDIEMFNAGVLVAANQADNYDQCARDLAQSLRDVLAWCGEIAGDTDDKEARESEEISVDQARLALAKFDKEYERN